MPDRAHDDMTCIFNPAPTDEVRLYSNVREAGDRDVWAPISTMPNFGDMKKEFYDTNADNRVDAADDSAALNGQPQSYYTNASNIVTGTLSLARIPTILTGISADQLDGQHGSFYQNADNLNAGNVSRARLGLLWRNNDTNDTTYPFLQAGRRTLDVAITWYSVVFDVAYDVTPFVMVTAEIDSTSIPDVRVRNVTTTGFDILSRSSNTVGVWFAIGKKI